MSAILLGGTCKATRRVIDDERGQDSFFIDGSAFALESMRAGVFAVIRGEDKNGIIPDLFGNAVHEAAK